MSENDRLPLAIISAEPPAALPAARHADTATGHMDTATGHTKWITELAERRHDLLVDAVDLTAARLPELTVDGGGAERPEPVQRLAARLVAADAYLMVLSDHRRRLSENVRRALDWLPDEWWAKPVAFVTRGENAGGVYALGQVLARFTAVGSVCLPETVNLPDRPDPDRPDPDRSDPDRPGTAGSPDECHDLECATRTMLDELVRWGRALREARSRRLSRA